MTQLVEFLKAAGPVIVGILAALVTHWLIQRRESRQVKRQKLEEFMLNFIRASQWMQKYIDNTKRNIEGKFPSDLYNEWVKDSKGREVQSDETAKVLATIYFPSLKPLLAEYDLEFARAIVTIDTVGGAMARGDSPNEKLAPAF